MREILCCNLMVSDVKVVRDTDQAGDKNGGPQARRRLIVVTGEVQNGDAQPGLNA